MGWRDMFPDYPADDMPALPAWMADSSWRNDESPSFTFLQSRAGDSNYEWARVWVNYPGESPRYLVTYERGDGATFDALQTDSWADVVAYAYERAGLSARYRRRVGYCPFLDDPTTTPADVTRVLLDA